MLEKEQADHLITTLEEHYMILQDWNGSTYLGLTLAWDYENSTVNLPMQGYVKKELQCFWHTAPTWPQHAPHAWTPPYCRALIQLTTPLNTSKHINKHKPNNSNRLSALFSIMDEPLTLPYLSTLAHWPQPKLKAPKPHSHAHNC